MAPPKPLPVDNSLRAYLELLFLDSATSVQQNGSFAVMDIHLLGKRVARRELRGELNQGFVVKEFEVPREGQPQDWDPVTVDVVAGYNPQMATWGMAGVFIYSDGRLVHSGGGDSCCARGVTPGSIALVNVPSSVCAMPTQGFHRGYWLGLTAMDNDIRRVLGLAGHLLATDALIKLQGLPAELKAAMLVPKMRNHRAWLVGCPANKAYDHLDASMS
jgi:hypothetical protein